VESGEWRVESGEWRVESGECVMATLAECTCGLCGHMSIGVQGLLSHASKQWETAREDAR